MMVNDQFNKELIKRNIEERNNKAREVFKNNMRALWDSDIYAQKMPERKSFHGSKWAD